MKKALLVGINYRGTKGQLFGCLNDVSNMKSMLLAKGFAENDITVLVDAEGAAEAALPTRKNIVEHFERLLRSEAPTLVFHYSGHGSWQPDRDGDEFDKRDESLVPLDYATAGVIVDDELKKMLVAWMSPKSRLLAVLDCCHSGTALDLNYTYFPTVRQDLKSVSTAGQVVMISGCADHQYSADAFINKQAQGALTYCLLFALKSPENKSWESLLKAVHKELKQGCYTQSACLSSSKPLDLKSKIDFF